jgi:hypothetical protein
MSNIFLGASHLSRKTTRVIAALATVGFGTLMQSFGASKYAGQRIRLSASVKSEEVSDGAGL